LLSEIELREQAVRHDELSSVSRMNGVWHQREIRVRAPGREGEIVQRTPQIDAWHPALTGGFAQPSGIETEDGIVLR
jgi:hypothetical protein